jgi:hypothetical protein
MDYILIEPAPANRSAFARWCLAQNPPIPTATATGSRVPTDLFQAVPDELLAEARIDGHVFRPVVAGKEPQGDGYVDEQPAEQPSLKESPQGEPARRTRQRKGGAE